MRISLGKILRPHGLRGEVVAFLTSDHPLRTQAGATWYLNDQRAVVSKIRSLPSQANAWVVTLDVVADRNAAEAIQGAAITGDEIDDPDADFVHQLVGCSVVDQASRDTIGAVVAVIQNPAADILELDNGVLVPLTFVTERRGQTVVAALPDGLLELYLEEPKHN
jgi:16S rRNA processing protein RimM